VVVPELERLAQEFLERRPVLILSTAQPF